MPATNFDYTITVTNLGPGAAANLSVTDNLPSASNLCQRHGGRRLISGGQSYDESRLARGERGDEFDCNCDRTSQRRHSDQPRQRRQPDERSESDKQHELAGVHGRDAHRQSGHRQNGPANVLAAGNLTYMISA